MHLILDFDFTIYRVGVLYEKWKRLFAGMEMDWQAFDQHAHDLFWEGFTAEKHARRLGIPERQIAKLVREHLKDIETESPSLLYEDVVPFFEKHEGAHRRTILTHGDPEYQDLRIQASGVGALVDDIRIATPTMRKRDHLRELVEANGEPLLFVDDNPNELVHIHEAGLPITLVRMNRGEGHYAEVKHEGDQNKWSCVSNLEELEEHVS